jgi:hypothetical protein
MSLQTRALLQTGAIIAGIIALSLLTTFLLEYMSTKVILYLAVILFFGFVIHLIYSIVLDQLKYQEALDKINNKSA